MPLTGSLDRELVEQFVGHSPLGQRPLDPAMRMISGPIVDAQTGMESDRLRIIERDFNSIITEIATSRGVDELSSERFLSVLKKNLKGYFDDLDSSSQEELSALLLERARLILDIPKSEVSYRAHALFMLEGVNEVFEEDLKMKVKQKLPVVSSSSRILHSDQRLMLGVKSFVRWALWGATALTSWNGICELLALVAHWGVLPENSTLVNGVQYLFGIPVSLAISEVVRLGKQNIEFIGSTRGIGLIESTKVLFRERRKLAILLFVLFGPDALTNITGGMELVFGKNDSAAQIDVARQVIEQNKKIVETELDKNGVDDAIQQASIVATRAAIDEALGTYGTPQGLGPRFHGLMAAYFSGQPYDLMHGPDDARCKRLDESMASEHYKDWTIDVPEKDSLCVYGHLSGGFRGWIIGNRAGAWTIDSVLSNFARNNSEYAVANNRYIDFHNEHQFSYPQEVAILWEKYMTGVEASMDSTFAKIDAVTATWVPEKSILVNKQSSRELIDPYFNALEKEEKRLRAQLEADVRALGKPYAEFDQELVRALDPKNTAVTIKPPEFSSIDFDFQSVDVGDSFREKNFIGKAFSAIERNPMNLSLVGIVMLASFVLGYLDMGFFWSVKKAFANDMDNIRKAGKGTKQQIQELLEALYTHLIRGPFSSMYLAEDCKSLLDEKFVRGRFVAVLADLSESMRFETIEEGLLLGSADRIMDKKLASIHPWKEELATFLAGIMKIESPAVRAFNRLSRAVESYNDEPEIFEQRVMGFDVGGERMTPSDVIIAIRDQDKARTSEEMSDRFRGEIRRIIAGDCACEDVDDMNLVERTNALNNKIQDLLVRTDLGEEAWLLDAIVVQEEVAKIGKVDVLIEGERRQREDLLKNYTRLIVALDKHLASVLTLAEGGMDAVKKSVVANKEEEARIAYEPEFARLEQAIKGTRYVLHAGAFASAVNPFTVLHVLRERIQAINDIDDELKKLKPEPTALRDRKMTLRANCAMVKGELQNAEVEFGGSVLEKIHTNRGYELVLWSDAHPIDTVTAENAQAFVTSFVDLYKRFYRGAPNFIDVHPGENIDAKNVSLAFNHFAHELRQNLDSFGLDEGMSRQFDFAWHIGTTLKKAFEVLSILSTKIDVPNRLPEVRRLTHQR